jgi:hypothetical protein
MRLQFSDSKIRPTFSALMTLMMLPLHAAQGVKATPDEAHHRIDITIDVRLARHAVS